MKLENKQPDKTRKGHEYSLFWRYLGLSSVPQFSKLFPHGSVGRKTDIWFRNRSNSKTGRHVMRQHHNADRKFWCIMVHA